MAATQKGPETRGGSASGEISSEDTIERRLLSAFRRGLRLSRLAWIRRKEACEGAPFVLSFLEGFERHGALRLGSRVEDLGAAAGLLSAKEPQLLNQDRPTAMRVPYSRKPVSLHGAMVAPVGDGFVWADREDGTIREDEFAVFCDLSAILEEESGLREVLRVGKDRSEYLARVLDGLQRILAANSEAECVSRLLEAACDITKSRVGLVALLGASPTVAEAAGGPFQATIVSTFGDKTGRFLGHVFDASKGLIGLAIRSRTPVPTTRHLAENMKKALIPNADLGLKAGDSVVAQPLGSGNESIGAVLLGGGDYDSSLASFGLRSICDAASLLIQRFRLEHRIAKEAMVDGLTGLLNRKAFAESLNKAVSLARRHGHELSVLMLDADHFKQINDRFGHLVGDRALRFIAEMVKRGLRESDVAGRYGGEEFAIALLQTGTEGAVRVAERIRQMCAAAPIIVDQQKLHVTISVGVASLDNRTQTGEALLAAADEALYAAKRAGRNCVVVANQGRFLKVE